MLCYGLWTRRRAAWLASIILSAVIIIPHFSKDHDHLGAIIAGVNLILLLVYANRFKVRSDRPTVMGALSSLPSPLCWRSHTARSACGRSTGENSVRTFR